MLDFMSNFFSHSVSDSIFTYIVGGFSSLNATRTLFSLLIVSFAIFIVRRILWG